MKKRPGTGRFFEMERAKRLERSGGFSHQNPRESVSKNENPKNSQLASHELYPPEISDSKSPEATGKDMSGLATTATEFSPELHEIMSSWLKLNPAIQSAILSIVRDAAQNA